MAGIAIEPRWLHEPTLTQLRGASARVALVAPSSSGKTRLLSRLAEADEEFLVVGATSGFDQVERMVLDIGAELGEGPAAALDEALADNLDKLQPALDVLDDALTGRRLAIDDFDALVRGPKVWELSDVLAPRREELLRWLRGSASVVATTADGQALESFTEIELPASELAPWTVLGEDKRAETQWWSSKRDNDRYRAALTYWKLHGEPPLNIDEGEVPGAVWGALPPSVQQLMALLACYGAQIPGSLFEQLVASIDCGSWALEFARNWLLIESSRYWYWLSPLWRRFVPRQLEGHARRDTHLRLAQFFVEQLQGAPGLDPRALQAAHRHFLAAGDMRQAREHLRYGVGLFLEAGRAASLDHEFDLAEQYYGAVLDLSNIDDRSRGYACHYYHYNRYKTERETIHQTERGYQESLRYYRDNALFWSRLVVARFEMKQWDEALRARQQASKAVPSESAREKHLLGRTVSKLLQRGHDNAAVVVWGETADISAARAESARYALEQRGQQGWSTELLRIPGLADTVFTRNVKLSFSRLEADRFRCRIREARIDGYGASMLAAMRDAVEVLRKEALTLLRQGPEQLDAKQRLRKRELLGLVDVLGSALRGPYPPYRWLTGRIEHEANGHLVFVPLAATEGERYALDSSLAASVSGQLIDARVRTGPGGVPRGPVLELVDPFADEAELESARKELDELLGS